jgi:hypothetical protein
LGDLSSARQEKLAEAYASVGPGLSIGFLDWDLDFLKDIGQYEQNI